MSAQLGSVSAQVAAVNTRIDDVIARTTAEHAEIRTEIRRLDDRLRAVELAIEPAPPAECWRSPGTDVFCTAVDRVH